LVGKVSVAPGIMVTDAAGEWGSDELVVKYPAYTKRATPSTRRITAAKARLLGLINSPGPLF